MNMSKETKDVCVEFNPKFQTKGHKLRYLENHCVLVLSSLNGES